MTTISIGGVTIPLQEISEGWINQRVVEARRAGQPLCVLVRVREPGAEITLGTPGCGGGGPGGRPPNAAEIQIFEAWRRRGLHDGQFSPGELQSFLRELARLT